MNVLEQEVSQSIERMFAAVAVDDRPAVERMLCSDFHAFENGVRMTGRALLDVMSRLYSEGRRYQWSVTEAHVEGQGASRRLCT